MQTNFVLLVRKMSETIGGLVSQGKEQLAESSDTPQLDSYLLIREVLARPREWLIAHAEEPVCSVDQTRIQALFARRHVGEPVAYIRGYQPFWKRDFFVTRDTLIPRPETELLMEITLARFGQQPRKVVDLGTGAGALAVSLAAERPGWQILGTDISESTLAIAKKNAGTLTNVSFLTGSWFTNIDGRFDLIISNPPYVRNTDPHLRALKFEPARALTAGDDGLDCLRKIIKNCHEYLIPGGHILFEHGYDQQEPVIQLLVNAGLTEVEGFRDLQGQPRAVMARSNYLER
jgi:release factor glutamine methyltransferase